MRLPGVLFLSVLSLTLSSYSQDPSSDPWVVYEGNQGPGSGKRIVLVSGDDEYRSEEALPMLAKILARHHGFTCTVLFAVDPATGEIKPDEQTNIPGLHLLGEADLMILFLRFRELPDEQMKHIVDYTNSGRPIIGLRTSTHAFRYTRHPDSPYAKFSFDSKAPDFEGGYGRQVFGESWVSHHGVHGKESTRGLINGLYDDHPILRGVKDIWGPTDPYDVPHVKGAGETLVFGQSLLGMEPAALPNFDKSIMPVAWLRSYTGESGKSSRIFATTMGAAVDLQSEGLRRLLVNACYWTVGMEDRIPEKNHVEYVGEYEPTFFGFGTYRKGLKPEDFK